MTNYKQVFVARTDIDLSPGKLATQVGHAAVYASNKADTDVYNEWTEQGPAKIVLKSPDKETLETLADEARTQGMPVSLVSDAGRTEIESGTVTVLGIGPAPADEIDKITGELPLYS